MKGKLETSERQRLIEEGIAQVFCCRFCGLNVLVLKMCFFRGLFIYLFCSGKNLKEALMTLEEDLIKLRDELQLEAQCIPNMTHPDVPIGGEDSSKLRNMVSSYIALISFLCF